MRYEHVGLSLFAAIAILVVMTAAAAVWLFLTDPVTVANAVGDGEITPFIRDLAGVILEALQGLLRYL